MLQHRPGPQFLAHGTMAKVPLLALDTKFEDIEATTRIGDLDGAKAYSRALEQKKA